MARAFDRNRQLADENARLYRLLTHALGDQWSARIRSLTIEQVRKHPESGGERPYCGTVQDGTPQVTALTDARARDND
jgi:hypothetical protein